MRKQGRSNTSKQRAPMSAQINTVIPLAIYVSLSRSSRSHLLQQEMERGMELKATELRLGLPGSGTADDNPQPAASKTSKRLLDDSNSSGVAKAQLVGWPPVRTYRKNSMQAMKAEAAAGQLVKVSMDGAPYLRKVDLKAYKEYKELREGLEELFKCFESSKKGSDQYAITYEDKDGDLMLVGDVPWEMFRCSCKKLRIMRGTDSVTGLASNQEQKTCKFI